MREGADQTMLMELCPAERKSHAVIDQPHLDGEQNYGVTSNGGRVERLHVLQCFSFLCVPVEGLGTNQRDVAYL